MKRVLLKKAETLKALIANNIMTKRGVLINNENFSKMITRGDIPYYVIKGTSKREIRYFYYDEVESCFKPNGDTDELDEDNDFTKMLIESDKFGMQLPQYIKAKEVYETYISKQLDNRIKQREHIPLEEIKSFLEIIISELKAKLYNVPNQVKMHDKTLTQQQVDYIYKKIDTAFADLYRKANRLEDKLSEH